jgi:hypothetical protein
MIIALLLMFHVQAEELKCPDADKFKFGNVELKLNLDGNKKQDHVVRFVADEGERHYYRRALILDAPKRPAGASEEQWLEPCQEGGEDPSITTIAFEKIKVGKHDLLLRKTEGGTAGTYEYLTVEEGKLQSAFSYSNPSLDGHFYENRKKELSIRITGDGELVVAGETIDLDGRAIKARCRVRELYLQLKYVWDTKAKKFKEVGHACVLDSAID